MGSSQAAAGWITRPGKLIAVSLAAAALALAVTLAAGLQGSALDRSTSESYGKLPLAFVPNRGQTDASVRYHAQGPGFGFYFSNEMITLDFRRGTHAAALDLRFIGSNSSARLEAMHSQPGRVNYLKGDRRLTNIPTYAAIRYRDLWPGIDMVIRGAGGKLKYEFRLSAGADPNDIRLAYAGAESLSLNAAGGLLVGTPLGTLRDSRPVAYQEVGGHTRPVASRYTLGKVGYAFAVGSYDHARPLVIDPGLEYSSFLGGGSSDAAWGIAVDGSGNAYIAGYTGSVDYPTTTGAYDTELSDEDAFVTKLNPSGSALIYSTLIGGPETPDPFDDERDGARSIAIDSQGNAYIGGWAGPGFPTTPGAYSASGGTFVAKLNASGSALVYSTRIGPGDSGGITEIAVDPQGNAHITGAAGPAWPTTPGAYLASGGDSYLTKLNATGSALVYSTLIDATVYGLAVDTNGSAYLAGRSGGSTTTSNGPTPTAGAFDTVRNGTTDGFASKFDPTGAIVYSTFLGGSSSDLQYAIAVDGSGSAYVTGIGQSADYPTTPGAYLTTPGQTFVTKLNTTGSALVYSTFLDTGGSNTIRPEIEVDSQGNAYVVRSTDNAELITTPNAYDRTHNGNFDVFVSKLNPAGNSLLYASYLGGGVSQGSNPQDFVAGAAVGNQGRVFITGDTQSTDFPTTPGAYDTTFGGVSDAFVSKLDTTIYGYARPTTATPASIRLVPAYRTCSSSNGSHGAPLDAPSCNPPLQTSDFLTVGTPDSNGNAAQSAGLLKLKAVGESPIDLTNGDQSDIEITFSITDVRRKSDFADYLGEVKVVLPLRLTDRYNATSLIHWGTMADTTFSFISNCIPTSDTDIGSTCSVSTTADAVMPGVTPEAKRAIWELGRVQVFDGGSDGDADDADNTLFAVQGLFAP